MFVTPIEVSNSFRLRSESIGESLEAARGLVGALVRDLKRRLRVSLILANRLAIVTSLKQNYGLGPKTAAAAIAAAAKGMMKGF